MVCAIAGTTPAVVYSPTLSAYQGKWHAFQSHAQKGTMVRGDIHLSAYSMYTILS